jgi:hypothetical protein
MKWVFILLLAAQTVLGFTDSIWQSPPALYTNALGMEFVGETVLRSRWAGDTNWNYPVTNAFGSIFHGDGYTAHVPFRASEADKITRQLEAVLPAYVLPFFTSGPDYCLNDWFAHDDWLVHEPYWPGSHWPKAELMSKCGTNVGIAVYTVGGTNTTIGVLTNGLGEVWTRDVQIGVTNNGTTEDPDIQPVYRIDEPLAYWIKRRDRINPLVVAEWKQYGNTATDGGTNNWEYYHGWPNEFIPNDIVIGYGPTMGHSQLFDLSPAQYPVFIVHLGGTNKYTSGLQLELNSELYWGEPAYLIYAWNAWDSYAGFIGEWTNNHLRQHPTFNVFEPPYSSHWDGGTIVLNSATQRSERAWLALGAPLKLTGTSPNTWYKTNIVAGVTNIVIGSGDTVSLQYTNKMTTHEGTKVWDTILLPEQLTAHYVAMTNMFLTPTTSWNWTNSVAFTSEQVLVSFSDEKWPESRTWVTNEIPVLLQTIDTDTNDWVWPAGFSINSTYRYASTNLVCSDTGITNYNQSITFVDKDSYIYQGDGLKPMVSVVDSVKTFIGWSNSRDSGSSWHYETQELNEAYNSTPAWRDDVPWMTNQYSRTWGCGSSTFVYWYELFHKWAPAVDGKQWKLVPVVDHPTEYYHTFSTNGAGVVSNHVGYLHPGDIPDTASFTNFFKEEGCPWIADFAFPVCTKNGTGASVASQPPYFNYTIHGDSVVDQEFHASAEFGMPFPTNLAHALATPAHWSWEGHVNVVGGAFMNGHGVDSSVAVTGLYTGTPHRVHFYSKQNFPGGMAPTKNYYRVHISDWTDSSVVTSAYFSCWTNIEAGTYSVGDCYMITNDYPAPVRLACQPCGPIGTNQVSDISYTFATTDSVTSVSGYSITNGGIADCATPPWEWYQRQDFFTNTAIWYELAWTNSYETNPVYSYSIMAELGTNDVDWTDSFTDVLTNNCGEYDGTLVHIREAGETHYSGDGGVTWLTNTENLVTNLWGCDPSEYSRTIDQYTTNIVTSNQDYRVWSRSAGETWYDPRFGKTFNQEPPKSIKVAALFSDWRWGQTATSTNISAANNILDVKVLIEWQK